jgi:hypothetical protein
MNGIDVNTINPMLKKVQNDKKKKDLKPSPEDKKRFSRIRTLIKRQRNSGK